MKNRLIAVLICCFVINLFAIPAFAAASPVVSVGEFSGTYGDTIEVPVILSGNSGFSSLGIEIGYDSTMLELTNVIPNSNVGATFTQAQAFTANPYNMGWQSPLSNTAFNGTLATLTFKITTSIAGKYPITVSYFKGRDGNYTDGYDVNYDIDYNDINLSYVSGNITVAGADDLMNVTVNGKKVFFVNENSLSGAVVVTLYDKHGNMKDIQIFTASDSINHTFTDVSSGDYVKAMWWKSFNSLTPVCKSQIIEY